jgi:hypothetical protein
MYNLVYKQMVAAGVAMLLPGSAQYYMGADGDVGLTKEAAYGMKIDIDVNYPQWIMFGDEVGTDICQKDDGQIGGTNYIVGKGTRANIKSNTNGGRFTVIGLTAGTGEPVMCIVIFAAEELTYDQRMGHDIRTVYNEEGSTRDNTGPGKSFPGGPVCHFRGKDIPALITCSPKGSITSTILKKAFERLDNLKVYERVPGRVPFALFDAHDSRLQVPFLRYVNTDPHRWKVCIGLPNGTGKWQVGDSSEQNGQWKTEMTREKGKLVLYKTRVGMSTVIEKSDIVPLTNLVWPLSFGRVLTNRTAIRDRGWVPANRILLLDPEILKTRASQRVTAQADQTPMPDLLIVDTTDLPIVHTRPMPIVDPPIDGLNVDDVSDISNVSSIAATASAATRSALDHLNFESGMAGDFTLDIFQHLVKKDSVCENLHYRYEQGRALRENIKKARLTGGALFKLKHVALDEEVLALREEKEREKVEASDQVISNAIQEFTKRKDLYEKVRNSPKTPDQYVAADLKAIIHFKKRKGDSAVPSGIGKLRERFHETKDRHDFTLKQFLSDRGYEGDDVNRILLSIQNKGSDEFPVEASGKINYGIL